MKAENQRAVAQAIVKIGRLTPAQVGSHSKMGQELRDILDECFATILEVENDRHFGFECPNTGVHSAHKSGDEDVAEALQLLRWSIEGFDKTFGMSEFAIFTPGIEPLRVLHFATNCEGVIRDTVEDLIRRSDDDYFDESQLEFWVPPGRGERTRLFEWEEELREFQQYINEITVKDKIKIVYHIPEQICALNAEAGLLSKESEGHDFSGEVTDCIRGDFFDKKLLRRSKVGHNWYEFSFQSEAELLRFYFGLKNRRASIRLFRTTWFDEVRHAEAIEDAIEDAVYTGREDVEIGETTMGVVYSKDKGSIEFDFGNEVFGNLTMPLSKAQQLIKSAKDGPTVGKDWMMADFHKFLECNNK